MKTILVVGVLAFATGTACAQLALDPQTGQVYPIIGGTVVRPSQTCEEAKWRLQENMRMAAEERRPLPPSFIAHSQRRIAHLCGQ